MVKLLTEVEICENLYFDGEKAYLKFENPVKNLCEFEIKNSKFGMLIIGLKNHNKIIYYTEKHINEMILFFEDYAKKNGYNMVSFDLNEISGSHKMRYIKYFYNRDYQKMDNDLIEFFGDLYLKQLYKGVKRATKKNLNKLKQQLTEIYEEKDCFLFNFKNFKFEGLNFYYKGKTNRITIDYCNKKFIMKFSEDIYQLENIDSFKTEFEKVLEKVNIRTRIKNQLNPPKIFYNNIMHSVLSRDQIEVANVIHQKILKYKNYEQIEKYFSEIDKFLFKKRIENYRLNIFITKIMDVYVVFNRNGEVGDFLEVNEAKEYYKQKCMESFNKELDEQLRKF